MYAALDYKRTMTCLNVRSSIVRFYSFVLLYLLYLLYFFKCIYVDVCLRNLNQYYRKQKYVETSKNNRYIFYSILSSCKYIFRKK